MLGATGIDFSLYRQQTVQRRILRRLALRNIRGLEAYAAQLQQDPAERNLLQRDLLICITSFFRDPESFEALNRLVFPSIVRNRPRRQGDSHLGAWLRHRRGGLFDCHGPARLSEGIRHRFSGTDFRVRRE